MHKKSSGIVHKELTYVTFFVVLKAECNTYHQQAKLIGDTKSKQRKKTILKLLIDLTFTVIFTK